jgi:hypothetical protein
VRSGLGFDLSPLFKGNGSEMGLNSPQHHAKTFRENLLNRHQWSKLDLIWSILTMAIRVNKKKRVEIWSNG